YKYDRNLTLNELLEVAEEKPVGMFKPDENLNACVVEQNAQAFIKCFEKSLDERLIPVYYQLSQAENEKLKKLDVKIRKAAKKDLEEISKLESENILVNTITKEQIKMAFEDENYLILKAVVDNSVVGFTLIQKSDEFNIDSIAVKKEFRNLGIASKMIFKTAQLAKKNKTRVLSLEVDETNISAYLLYKKLGFEQRRIRKNYYANGANCIEMFKQI
ncbi:MAG: GNAT family N-acetyltransferase, partial [Clostridia bacterium]|nr:GNAT family N-acetyltransferase [Clostridia bacterium]